MRFKLTTPVLLCSLLSASFIKNAVSNEPSQACVKECKEVADAINKAAKAVVNLYVLQVNNQIFNPFLDDPAFQSFFGHMIPNQPRVSQGSGSGVILKESGIVVTCDHVVKNAAKIKVKLNDGREFDAKVIEPGPSKLTDITFLQIQKDEHEELPVATMGDSDQLVITEPIYAVGNSFGIGQSITSGIVSAFNRIIDGKVMFQVDAAVNPGNSGGAVFNKKGEYVGTPSAIATKTGANHGVGFAIPSVLVKSLLQKMETKTINAVIWTGLSTQELNYDMAKSFKDFDLKNYNGGVIITRIHDKSPFKNSLQKQDVILSIDGAIISSHELFNYIVSLKTVDKPMTLKIWRQDKGIFEINTSPIILPESEKSQAVTLEGKNLLTGYTVAEVTDEVLHKEPIDPSLKGKVVIIGIPKEIHSIQGSLFNFSLQIGDELLKVNDVPIKTTQDVINALDKGFKSLIIRRGGQVLSFSQG